jgi:hypothetical protein
MASNSPATTSCTSPVPSGVPLACYEPFLRRNFISTTSQVRIPRKVLDVIGPADRSLPIASDWDMYIRAKDHVAILKKHQRLNIDLRFTICAQKLGDTAEATY